MSRLSLLSPTLFLLLLSSPSYPLLKWADASDACSNNDGDRECQTADRLTGEGSSSSSDPASSSKNAVLKTEKDEPRALPLELNDTDFGTPQRLPDDPISKKVHSVIQSSVTYMRDVVYAEDRYAEVRDSCRNYHEDCSLWSASGVCHSRQSMLYAMYCGPACQSCLMHDVALRCPLDPDGTDALGPGDLDAAFVRVLTTDRFRRYRPRVLSRPPDGPWVISFDSFLNSEECDQLIAHGHAEGYSWSMGTGDAILPDGTRFGIVEDARTRSTSICQQECENDPVVGGVLKRITDISGLPGGNLEPLQLLRYQEGRYHQVR